MKHAALVIGMSFSANALAANELGNGGDVMDCLNSPLNSLELLDYHEAENKFSLPVELGGDHLSVDEKVHFALDRLSRIDPTRAERYRGWFATFWEETSLSYLNHLPELNDEGPVTTPHEDCVVRQVAYQMQPELPGDKKFYIKKRDWERLDNNHRAGIVLHELIYLEAKGHRHRGSRKTRFFNALISNSGLDQLTFAEYGSLLKNQVSLPAVYEYGSFSLEIGSLIFDEFQRLLEAELTDDTTLYYSSSRQDLLWLGRYGPRDRKVLFHTNGRLQEIPQNGQGTTMWLDSLCFNTGNCVKEAPISQCTELYVSHLKFYADGDLSFMDGCFPEYLEWQNASGHVSRVISNQYQHHFHPDLIWRGGEVTHVFESFPLRNAMGETVSPERGSQVQIDENGYITRIKLANDTELTDRKGDRQLFRQGTWIEFDSAGRALKQS